MRHQHFPICSEDLNLDQSPSKSVLKAWGGEGDPVPAALGGPLGKNKNKGRRVPWGVGQKRKKKPFIGQLGSTSGRCQKGGG